MNAFSLMPSTASPTCLPGSVIGLRCLLCDELYLPEHMRMTCPNCGREGILDVVYDYEEVRKISLPERQVAVHSGMWRYRSLLPLASDAPLPLLSVGNTPLYQAKNLAASLGLKNLWVKDEGRQPTCSLKDRASALAVAMARSFGVGTIATASTGNAAAALAGMSAGTGLESVIFVPSSILPAKVAQLLVYGAKVVFVDGNYDQAFELCLDASDYFGWYNRSTGHNPYMSEGKKTVVYEIVEELQENDAEIDAVVVGVGDGCILGAVYKGFYDLLALRRIERIPKIIGVQSVGSDYLYQVWRNDGNVLNAPTIHTHGVADSLMAGLPRDRIKAMRAVQSSGGAFVRVSDAQILSAIPALARATGIFAEPAAAAAFAGVLQAMDDSVIGKNERVVIISTGNGLKDVASAISSVEQESHMGMRCNPNMASLLDAWKCT